MAHWSYELRGNRGSIGDPVPKKFKIDYTPGFNPDKDAIKVQRVHTQASEAAKPVTVAKKREFAITNLTGTAGRVRDALIGVGFSGQALEFAMIQLYLESGNFTNTLTRVDNNPGSIMWFKGQKKGTFVKGNKTFAIHFDNLDQFAKQYRYEMTKGSNPMGAADLKDFAHRLKLNNYMGDEPEDVYYQKLLDVSKHLGTIALLADQTHETGPKKKESWWSKQKWYVKAAIIAGGFVVTKKVLD